MRVIGMMEASNFLVAFIIRLNYYVAHYDANLFPRLILICLYREPQPQKPHYAPHHRPQTPSNESPNPKNPIQNPNPKTLTPKPP